MSDVTLMLHGSLQWGVREVEEWHFLTHIYFETLKVVERVREARVTIQWGGQDLEWISHTHPEFIELVKDLENRGQVEIAMGGYSHNFQGGTPDANMMNLELGQEICEKVFGHKARGFWPAEGMLNRGMPAALKEKGFAYTWFDNLSVQNSHEMEYGTRGKSFLLAGSHGATIPALPFMHFEDHRRGAGAGAIIYAESPISYDKDPTEILKRVSQVPLLAEVSDWEHFTLNKNQLEHDVGMGTYDVGDRKNRIDPEKIECWEEILSRLLSEGHRLVTASEALELHEPAAELELIDGRGYSKTDRTRTLDACGWYGEGKIELAGTKAPHRMSDQESYSHSFKACRALQELEDFKREEELDLKASWKNALISLCSAHRSGGNERTVKQQLLDRVDRVVELRDEVKSRLVAKDQLRLAEDLPEGYWPVDVNQANLEDSGQVELVCEGRSIEASYEKSALCANGVERTHVLWLKGPLARGTYEIKMGKAGNPKALSVEEDRGLLTIDNGAARVVIDAERGGIIQEWSVGDFRPFSQLGGMAYTANWQESDLSHEQPCELHYQQRAGGLCVTGVLDQRGVKVRKEMLFSPDLKSCLMNVTAYQREFVFYSPLTYDLNAKHFRADAQIHMVAEGHDRFSSEKTASPHHVHHLGSGLIGYGCQEGSVALCTQRLYSSPCLYRQSYSGTYVLMDSRPRGFFDEAYTYSFAEDPVLETLVRVEPGASAKEVEAWQGFQSHPPVVNWGSEVNRRSSLEWTNSIEHIGEVNPYF